jgi:FG-GAP-like repeat
MRVRPYLCGLVVLLLALGVYRVNVAPPRRDRAFSPERTPSSSGTSHLLSDLDGDGRADPVMLHSGGLQPTIELYRSHTQEWAVLPVRAAAGGYGSLSAQDVDGDGDTDLLWHGSQLSHAVMVWLNDGAGRFECLCPPESHEWGSTLSGPGVSAAHPRRPDSALSLERTFSPGDALTVRWDFHGATPHGSYWPEHLWPVSCLKRCLSTRSPPLHLC